MRVTSGVELFLPAVFYRDHAARTSDPAPVLASGRQTVRVRLSRVQAWSLYTDALQCSHGPEHAYRVQQSARATCSALERSGIV